MFGAEAIGLVLGPGEDAVDYGFDFMDDLLNDLAYGMGVIGFVAGRGAWSCSRDWGLLWRGRLQAASGWMIMFWIHRKFSPWSCLRVVVPFQRLEPWQHPRPQASLSEWPWHPRLPASYWRE